MLITCQSKTSSPTSPVAEAETEPDTAQASAWASSNASLAIAPDPSSTAIRMEPVMGVVAVSVLFAMMKVVTSDV